ncbi:MAG: phenylalanine--tRNA ligase subunit beta [Syntrophothermus sp.]
MKISLNWIRNYVDLTGITTDEIIEKLTISGLEVEDIEDKAKLFDNFVVGFVKERKKHPNADKLSVCTVSDGIEDFNVVCGAPNVAEGQKIAFAKIGAVVPEGGFKITKAKLRGEVSMGMICSEKELGLSGDHSGIMVLDASLKEGTPLAEALGLNDVILELGITPNRPDALCHIGVARDLAAIFNRKVSIPSLNAERWTVNEKIEDSTSVEVLNTADCPRYTAKVVKGITVKESPAWLKQRLTAIGLRPINNIVDITNFILHEMGQPLHAFDLNMLKGNKIIVKDALEGEPFTTLDSKERKLTKDDLMICDGERSVAVAGVMGGENSEVTAATKDVLIESAYFNPSSVRKTAKSLTISTDASYRFERGTDPNNTLYAAERAAELMAELGGGKVLSGTIDVYPQVINPIELTLRFSRIPKVLGFPVEPASVVSILENLGFTVTGKIEENVNVIVPTFRPDVEREIDLIEEVARIYGYDKIPEIERIAVTLDRKTDQSSYKDMLRTTATGLGFYEIISNSLQPIEIASVTGEPIKMLNPQSMDMAALRTSLLPGALFAVAKNINVGEKNLMLFEIGNVFNLINPDIKSFSDFSEVEKIQFIVTGKAETASWFTKERNFDMYDLKGYVNSFLGKIGLDNVAEDLYTHVENKNFDSIFAKTYQNTQLGYGGMVSREVLKKFDINQDVFAFEFNLAALTSIVLPPKRFKELLKYPKVIRDCAFIVDQKVTCDDITRQIFKGSSSLLKKVELFDIFESGNLGSGKKSMAFSLEYFDENRTLKDEEVEKDFNRAVNSVVNELNAEFRGAN